jgi:hypothetical protein
VTARPAARSECFWAREEQTCHDYNQHHNADQQLMINSMASAFSGIGMPEEPKPLMGRDQTPHTAPLAARDFWSASGERHLKHVQQLLGNDVIALIACLVECEQNLVREAPLDARRGRGDASFGGFVAQRSVLPSRTPGGAPMANASTAPPAKAAALRQIEPSRFRSRAPTVLSWLPFRVCSAQTQQRSTPPPLSRIRCWPALWRLRRCAGKSASQTVWA